MEKGSGSGRHGLRKKMVFKGLVGRGKHREGYKDGGLWTWLKIKSCVETGGLVVHSMLLGDRAVINVSLHASWPYVAHVLVNGGHGPSMVRIGKMNYYKVGHGYMQLFLSFQLQTCLKVNFF